ncbi:pyridoxal-phosphate dependent enzyme [Microtetraspora niveoalba]|uniref:pyridoxal-phosphate dependent enzyme n=1 Tax=Microtetraspora niveoalba TaxID=46175 RepID=UPI000831F17C|nr:pyridoxal-phosphate dependent enzyme [Microtetraspora niveoalba]
MIDALLNLSAYCPGSVLDPVTREPITLERLEQALPPSLAALELSGEHWIPIPDDLREVFHGYRPTPLFEATAFAQALGTGCRIFIKDEGATPSSNHKANSAFWIAYHCARDGVREITTETTGNWGIALATAASRFGIQVICFIDEASVAARPDRVRLMEAAGARVEVVGPDTDDDSFDPLVLSANRAVSYTGKRPRSRYIFGSVYTYFIVPQTIVGLEARQQLGEVRPDVVVGSCGGGANLLGIAGAFLTEAIEYGTPTDVVCAESELCPIVSKGRMGEYSIDDQDFYPRLRTYGLDHLLGDDAYIGGLGSTIVAAPVARFHADGLIRTATFSDEEARSAAELFGRTQSRTVALETGYQLAAVVAEAERRPSGNILVNISSTGRGISYA